MRSGHLVMDFNLNLNVFNTTATQLIDLVNTSISDPITDRDSLKILQNMLLRAHEVAQEIVKRKAANTLKKELTVKSVNVSSSPKAVSSISSSIESSRDSFDDDVPLPLASSSSKDFASAVASAAALNNGIVSSDSVCLNNHSATLKRNREWDRYEVSNQFYLYLI